MSLPQRQEVLSGGRGGFRAQLANPTSTNTPSGTQFAALNSRTGSPSPLSNTLIPRDYLGTRPDPLAPREGKKYNFDAGTTGNYEQRPSDTGPQKDNNNQTGTSPGLLTGTLVEHPYQDRPSLSPPDSPILSGSSVKSDPRQHSGTMPRTSSIDSAISSISTASQQKASIETTNASPTEIRNLIATAGSAENLVQHLLKDKQHAASQNAQLWRLVDKQRALLLGLNKDLERLTKEKDRYKMRLKEMQEHSLSQSDARPRKDSQSPLAGYELKAGEAERKSDAVEGIRGQRDALSTPDNKTKNAIQSSPIDPAMVPSPLQLIQQQREGANAAENFDFVPSFSERSSPVESAAPNDNPAAYLNEDATMDRSPTNIVDPNHSKPMPMLLVPEPPGPPCFALIEPSPLNATPSSSFPTSRKPPPAPLKLDQAKGEESVTQDANQADRAREEGSLTEDSPLVDRGRKKTREEDDYEREAAVLKEQEARSRSKKEKRPKSDVEEIIDDEPLKKPPTFPIAGLPASPRQPPPSLQNRLAPPSSLSAVLRSGKPVQHSTTETVLAARPVSPGLPMSPRPMDRPIGSPMPRKPRDIAAISSGLPMTPRGMMSGLLLSPRAPKHPMTLPSTPKPNQQGHHLLSPHAGVRGYETEYDAMQTSQSRAPEVYQGLVDEAYPDFLLPPNALPSIQIKVASSRLRPSRNSIVGTKTLEDNAVFTLSVFSRSDNRELWRLEKIILSLPQMDQRLRPLCNRMPSLPDRKLFNGHSPAMMDARRAALDSYFDELLDTEMNESAAAVICGFLSTDVVESRDESAAGSGRLDDGGSSFSMGPDGRPRRTGYLTKRGKNFGGWKARYFVLENPELRYFESPGGAHLGTIKLLSAQIGKQSQSDSPTPSSDDDNQYRHAFLILEPKRKDSASLVRHVLCAESDAERDEWVEALLHYVDDVENGVPDSKAPGGKVQTSTSSLISVDREERSDDGHGNNQLRAIQYENTVPGIVPTYGSSGFDQRKDDTPPASSSSATSTAHNPNISGPLNGAVISDVGSWGNKSPAAQVPKDKDQKKRSLFHFKQKNSSDMLASNGDPSSGSGHSQAQIGSRHAARPVFGLPLVEAVEFCSPIGINVNLPAVVYRCVEYLRQKNAVSEEGLFRLSGSNLLIRTLKERFNTEGDVDLLADEEYYDVHAVASLFKTYLRELPNPLLTRELHIEFLRVLDLEEHARKVAAYNSLVHRLPSANFSLLKTLSEFLLLVINNADRNKMSIRNVGIVFSPTLNIPAPVFSIFLTDFAAVFGNQAVHQTQEVQVQQSAVNSLSADDIRSPRRQMFSDLPTPAYNQTSFSSGPSPFRPGTNEPSYGATPSAADTGFIPVQQSYESRNYNPLPQATVQAQQQHPHLLQQSSQNAEYGSLNRMMMADNTSSAKAKRRDSSMLFSG